MDARPSGAGATCTRPPRGARGTSCPFAPAAGPGNLPGAPFGVASGEDIADLLRGAAGQVAAGWGTFPTCRAWWHVGNVPRTPQHAPVPRYLRRTRGWDCF